MDGTILLVQEGRFMVETEQGESHLFILARDSECEPQQLSDANHKKIRVTYSDASDVIGCVAHSVQLLEENAT
jgi:hypothetical protein